MGIDALEIGHEEADGRGAFFVEREGQRLGELTYSRVDEHRVIIDHTEVHSRLQGLGVARRMLDAAVAWARATGTRVIVTCPYAKGQFEKDPTIRDVLDVWTPFSSVRRTPSPRPHRESALTQRAGTPKHGPSLRRVARQGGRDARGDRAAAHGRAGLGPREARVRVGAREVQAVLVAEAHAAALRGVGEGRAEAPVLSAGCDVEALRLADAVVGAPC